jgi:hypothetical protein
LSPSAPRRSLALVDEDIIIIFLESFKVTNPTTEAHNNSAHAFVIASDVPVTRSIFDITTFVKVAELVDDDAAAGVVLHAMSSFFNNAL